MRRSLLTSAVLCLVALMADAHAEPPPAASSSTGGAEAVVPLAEQRPPAAASPVPEAAEWEGAQRVSLARPLPGWCEARLQREWLRIRCDLPEGNAAGAAVLSGSAEDVDFLMTRPDHGGYGGTTEVVMPLRRGDRRLVQLTRTNDGYEGTFAQEPMILFSAEWLDAEGGPIVTPTPSVVAGSFRGLRFADRPEAEPVAKKEGVELKWSAPWVVAIEPGSAAAEAGVKLGDKILNESLLVFETTAEGVNRYLTFAEGDEVQLAVMRGKSAKITPFRLRIAPTYD